MTDLFSDRANKAYYSLLLYVFDIGGLCVIVFSQESAQSPLLLLLLFDGMEVWNW